jgi:ADP-heptose:LPS heptosyltransferase
MIERFAYVKKILWVRPDALGDALLAASLLEPIKKHFNHAQIIVFCQAALADFYRSCPCIDDVITFNKKLFMLHRPYRKALCTEITKRSVDTLFNTVYSRELAFDCLALLPGITTSFAFKVTQRRGRWDLPTRYNRGYSHLIESLGNKNERERYSDFLDALSIAHKELNLCIWINETDEAWAEQFFASHDLTYTHTIGFFAGAQSSLRIYRHYAQALNEAVPHDIKIVALGASADGAINREVLKGVCHQVIDMAGKTSIGQAAAIIKRCRLVVGAETGLAHVACAVETPNVVILGGGHFGRFMPYSPLTIAVVAPYKCYGCNWRCHYGTARCVHTIKPETVAYALKQGLENRSQRNNPAVVMQHGEGYEIDSQKYEVMKVRAF